MPRYVVTWEIDIECATSPRQAAEQAWDILRHPDSTANVFVVYPGDGDGEGVTVDLLEHRPEQKSEHA
jgi:hypothetical protein